jgi:replicative superfamily II helicase
MPPITKVADQAVLVETKAYPHAHWPFGKFNPVQSRVFEFYDRECNGLIAAATSAGKTVCAEKIRRSRYAPATIA